jgi:hypothetical protein
MWWKSKFSLNIGIGLMLVLIGSVVAQAEAWGPETEVGDLAAFDLAGDIPVMEGKVTLIDFWAS